MHALFHHHVKLLFQASRGVIAQLKHRLRTDWKHYLNVFECTVGFHSWSSIESFNFDTWRQMHFQRSSGRSWCCTRGVGCTEAEQPVGDLPDSKSQASSFALWRDPPRTSEACQNISRNIRLNSRCLPQPFTFTQSNFTIAIWNWKLNIKTFCPLQFWKPCFHRYHQLL